MKYNKFMNGYLAIILAAIFWGLAAPVQKAALSAFTPSTLSFWRFLLASLIFIVFYVWKKEKFPRDLKSIFKLFFISSLFSLGVAFYVNGLRLTTVSFAQVLSLSLPIFTSVGALIFLKEKVTKLQFFGFFLGLVGLSIIIFVPIINSQNVSLGSTLGNTLILLANLTMAGYFVGSRYVSSKFTSSTLTLGTLLSSLLIFFTLALIESKTGVVWIPSTLNIGHILEIVYLGLFGSVITFFLFQWGMKTAGAFFAGLSPYIQFPVVVLSGVLFFGDKITPIFITGALLSISGSVLASKLIKKSKGR